MFNYKINIFLLKMRIPDQEIRILPSKTDLDAVFREEFEEE